MIELKIWAFERRSALETSVDGHPPLSFESVEIKNWLQIHPNVTGHEAITIPLFTKVVSIIMKNEKEAE